MLFHLWAPGKVVVFRALMEKNRVIETKLERGIFDV